MNVMVQMIIRGSKSAKTITTLIMNTEDGMPKNFFRCDMLQMLWAIPLIKNLTIMRTDVYLTIMLIYNKVLMYWNYHLNVWVKKEKVLGKCRWDAHKIRSLTIIYVTNSQFIN